MIIFLLQWLLLLCPSQNPEQAYQDGRYEEAQQLFRVELTQPGAARGALNYNIGNCAFRLGAHADAVLHYYRAQQFLPNDERVTFNLRLAQQALGLAQPPVFGRLDTAISWLDGFASRTLLVMIALLQAAGVLLAIFAPARYRLFAALLVILAWAGAARLIHNHWFASAHAVVLAPTIELRREPHLAMAVTDHVHAGERLVIAEASDRWLRVVHDGRSGWTQHAGIGRIE